MRPDDVDRALDALASEVPAPRADASAIVERGRRRTRQRRVTLVGVVALLVAVVVAAGALSRAEEGTPPVASEPTTLPPIDVRPHPTTPPTVYTGPVPIPLAFASPTEGWLCSTPTMEYTTDAGATWKNVHVPSHAPKPPRAQLPVCAAIADGDAWMLTASTDADGLQVIRVSDGGRRVEKSAFPELPTDWTVRNLAFADQDHGWAYASDAAGGASTMLATTDGGRTWESTTPTRGVTLFASPDEGWAAIDLLPSDLAHTTDGGRTWEREEVSYESDGKLRPIGATGDGVIVLAWTPADADIRPSVIVAAAGGELARRRIPRDLAANNPADIAASATDLDHWQVALGSKLWTTDTAGRAWRQVADFAGVSAITDVHYLTPEIGFVSATGTGVAADGTVVLQTNDGGESWSTVDIQSPPLDGNAPVINFPGGIIGCPTHPLTAPPVGNPPAGLIEAAKTYVGAGPNGWTPDSIIAYRVGDTSKGQFGSLFALHVGSCGPPTVGNAWVVELHSNGIKGQAYIPRAYLAFAHSADGWHVFGRYP